MQPIYWISKNLYYVYFKLLGGKIENLQQLRDWKFGIVAANHISVLDPPLVGAVTPHAIHFLAKKELFTSWWLGPIIRRLNAIPIRRGAIDRHAMKQVMDVLANKKAILIFPEGSRSYFKARPGIGKIAIQAQAPVLPLYIHNSDRLLSWRKLRVVVGTPIPVEKISQYEDNKDGYRQLAEHILHRINTLGAETADDSSSKGRAKKPEAASGE